MKTAKMRRRCEVVKRVDQENDCVTFEFLSITFTVCVLNFLGLDRDSTVFPSSKLAGLKLLRLVYE